MPQWFTRIGETFPRSVAEAFPGELEGCGLLPARTVTIRPARLDEVEPLVAIALRFIRTTAYPVLADHATAAGLRAYLLRLFGAGEVACLRVAEDAHGIIGGIALLEREQSMLPGYRYADEVLWWVQPSRSGVCARARLFEVGEDWARSRGLKLVTMKAKAGSRTGRFYETRGYQPMETISMKVL